MLTSFGIFWGSEGAGAHWPGGEIAYLVILAFVLGVALLAVRWLQREHAHLAWTPAPVPGEAGGEA